MCRPTGKRKKWGKPLVPKARAFTNALASRQAQVSIRTQGGAENDDGPHSRGFVVDLERAAGKTNGLAK
jgi:hypothetical protein